MAKDRLPELLQRSISTISITNGGVAMQTANVNRNEMAEQNSTHLDAILEPYSDIRQKLALISYNLDTMNRMIQTINIRNFNENVMDELRSQNLKIGTELMNKFQNFKINLPAENDYCLEARMKRTLFYGLHQSYVDVWNKNEKFLELYERKLKTNLQMHSKIIKCNATEEEIEELIANKTTNLFVGNILEETEKERKSLRDLMGRLTELKKLEKSIEDVNTLFIKIQTLVMEQSETIQRVEFHAQQAAYSVDKGADELVKAEKSHKKAVKKKFWLLSILATVIILLILIAIFL